MGDDDRMKMDRSAFRIGKLGDPSDESARRILARTIPRGRCCRLGGLKGRLDTC